MVSPYRRTTEPSACFAILPVSMIRSRAPIFTLFFRYMETSSRSPDPRGQRPVRPSFFSGGSGKRRTFDPWSLRAERGSTLPFRSLDRKPKTLPPPSPPPALRFSNEPLLPDPEPVDQLLVTGRVLHLQVIEQPAPLTYHLQQPTPGVVILLVRLEVLGQLPDPLGQQRHLHLGGTGVLLVGLELLHQRRLTRRFNGHDCLLPFRPTPLGLTKPHRFVRGGGQTPAWSAGL